MIAYASDNTIFSVSSRADLGVDRYFLDEEGCRHILLGHRDLKNFIIRGVQETVENPTHVYRSSYDLRRFQFVSHDVVTQKGYPLNVIVHTEGLIGRVVTASPKRNITGNKVWDVESGIYASYDRRSDVLYLSQGDSRPSYADDDKSDERIWLRYHEDDDTPSGVTIFAASAVLAEQSTSLAAKVADFLSVNREDVEARLKDLVP